MRTSIYFFLAFLFIALMSQADAQGQRVKTGEEVFVNKYLNLVKGKSVGIITNDSGVLQDGSRLLDTLERNPGVKVVTVFIPGDEIVGNTPNGKSSATSVQVRNGIRFYTFSGRDCGLAADMLKDIEVLIYDVQGMGTRRCPSEKILYATLRAAAQKNIEYIVLDRPDMLQADMVDGPVPGRMFRLSEGLEPVPCAYGMTPGEFAEMLNGAHMLGAGVKANLRVITMRYYKRNMWYDQTGLEWIEPLPVLRDMNAVELYPGSVLLDAANVSVGRGTHHPYETVGAPFIDGEELAALMNAQHLPGVKYESADFIPRAHMHDPAPIYAGVACHGVRIVVTDRSVFRPVEAGVYLVWAISKVAPREFTIDTARFDRRAGSPGVLTKLSERKSPKKIFAAWGNELRKFERLRTQYLLY